MPEQLLTDADLTRLRGQLRTPLQAWQGSHFHFALAHARAWRQTGDVDFLGKSVGILRTAVENYQKDWFDGMELVAFGDGVRKTFQLRPTAYGSYAGGVHGKVSPRETVVVTKSAGDVDDVNWYADFVKVFDADREYVYGTDWTRSENDWNKQIHWLGGARPAVGDKFTVEITSRIGGTFWRLPPINDEVTFPEAPAAGAAVYAQYC